MTILLDIRDPAWMREADLRDFLAPLLPGVPIYCETAGVNAASVTLLATTMLRPGVVASLPALKLVQKLGAGVEGIVGDPALPDHVRVTRLKSHGPAQEIAEYCVAYVLSEQHHIPYHRQSQSHCLWKPIAPKQTSLTTVGVLGLGHIGSTTAQAFVRLGFRVIGWSRTEKSLPGVECCHGNDQLPMLLEQCDYVASILPSTDRTRNLFDLKRFQCMKNEAVLINAGRGDLIIEEDLLIALDTGMLKAAILDVFRQEPLPATHPFWNHPQITVTPHVSGWHLDDGLRDIAENYRRMVSHQPLLHEVDRIAGY